ncbi:MAG: nucleoside triphosphate pyrophosphohydrolase [Bacteroidales bacterium]|nr:nucleoside triphosphate pyrophosphohydrolase [Bacteroidales bacterium]
MHTREEKLEAFAKALEIMETLRAKCPWNAAQTTQSLRPMTVEEVYELSDAVLRGDDGDLRKELGDVLLHIIFYSRIAEEEGRWDIADVLQGLIDKMVFRHPHVFGNGASEGMTEEEVAKNWELIKTKEKGGNRTILGGVPKSFPPLLKAYAMQDKARAVGFDWEEKEQVWDKVREELGEVLEAVQEEGTEHKEEEFGDLLFAVVNAARLYDIDPSVALDKACGKFRRRFGYLEEQTLAKGMDLKRMTLAQMDEIWDEGKAKGL